MEDAGVLSGRVSLANRIQKAIAPYKYNSMNPPFTPDEFFTMVIAVTGRPVTKTQVLKWVFANFAFYRRMVEREFVGDDSSRIPQSNIFRAKITDVLCNHELYLKKKSVQGEADTYIMTVASCERVLSRALPPHDERGKKAFRLFDLPSELRNMILDLVFKYPQSGLRFDFPGLNSANINPSGRDTWTWRVLTNLSKTAKIKDVLAPLRVNKQFYEEAKGSFFAVNQFHFSSNLAMARLLAKIPESQRRHIHCLTLDYQIGSYKEAKKAIALLTTCGLKKLNLHLDEDEWKKKLRTMRGLEEVNFYGCPTVEALIKADMLKPKPKPKQKRTGGKKRKAEGEREGAKKSIRR
ncbi:hypothetical protein KC351_g2881 [Hortaea werneckii]|nr:hypothetical protein KC351_g2881 [Hortaea werneckii]